MRYVFESTANFWQQTENEDILYLLYIVYMACKWEIVFHITAWHFFSPGKVCVLGGYGSGENGKTISARIIYPFDSW